MRAKRATVSRDQLEASICRDSFYEFVQRFWDTVIPETPVWNWHIRVLCDELQATAERVFAGLPSPYELVINISPGTTKSTVCSVMFPAWTWTRMATCRSICGSYAYPLAMDLSRKCRDIIQSDKYRRLFGDVGLRDDQNTKGYFANTRGGSRVAVSTGGSVTGMHGHFIIVDDPLDPNQAVSEAEMKAANRWLAETLPTRKVDKVVAQTILIMQRLHQEDPSGVMLRMAKEGKASVRHICLPAEVDRADRSRVRPRRLYRKYTDGLMDPVRLPKQMLEAMRARMGEYGYAGQFLQSPVPLGGGMFKVALVRTVPTVTKIVRSVRYWDKAGTADGGAYTVGARLDLEKSGRIVVSDVRRGQWDASQREIIILDTAKSDGIDVIIGVEQEPGSGGKESAENTAKNLRGFRVRIDRPVGNKVLRADPYAVQVNSGNVALLEGPWNNDYISELQYFPHSTYKDQVDASSGAFALLTKPNIRVGGLAVTKGR